MLVKLNAVGAFKVYYQVSFDDSIFYRPPNYTGPKGRRVEQGLVESWVEADGGGLIFFRHD